MKDLNPRERAVLELIEKNIAVLGYAPSVRDIQEALGYRSTSTVQMYLDRLLAKGSLRREEGKSRSLRLTRAVTVQNLRVLSWDGSPTGETLAYALSQDAGEHLAVREWEGGISAKESYLICRLGETRPGETFVVRGDRGILAVDAPEENAEILGALVSRILLY